MKRYLFIVFLLGCTLQAFSQSPKYLYLYQNDGQIQKISLDKADSIVFPTVLGTQMMYLYRSDGNTNRISLANVDSLTVTDNKLFKGNYLLQRYGVATLNIDVENGEEITSKESEDYKNCVVTLDGKGDYADYTGTARIRGRGNSSWRNYPKKPYRIKLDKKAEILGMGADRDWVLLSNYRDPSMLMNAYCFEVARALGLGYTSKYRYVEVTLNGEYIGLYQLTEQVEQGKNRVNVDDEKGVLLHVDLDDGPGLSPDATDNFWSAVYGLPICVKYPEDPTEEQLTEIRNDFADLEDCIKSHDYELASTRIDLQSLIYFLIIEDLSVNVEMQAPRSIYMYKDSDNVYHMGPAWDYDAGFSYSWQQQPGEDWLSSHIYFTGDWSLYGGNPSGANNVNRFFINMFRDSLFTREYVDCWNRIEPELLTTVWDEMDSILLHSQKEYAHNLDRWPITPDYTSQVDAFKDYLRNHIALLSGYINNYPFDSGKIYKPQGDTCKNIIQTFTVSYPHDDFGYTGLTVTADKQSLCDAFQMDSETLSDEIGRSIRFYGLNSDNSLVDYNTANGYGHWYNAEGDVCYWGDGSSAMVASEFNESGFTFSVVQYPGRAATGSQYTTKQALIYTDLSGDKYQATFVFNTTIGEAGWSCSVTDGKPEGGTPEKKTEEYSSDGNNSFDVKMNITNDYNQFTVSLDADDVLQDLGYDNIEELIAAYSNGEVVIVNLNADLSEGESTANHNGAWFNAEGNICRWGDNSKVSSEPKMQWGELAMNLSMYPGAIRSKEQYIINQKLVRSSKECCMKFKIVIN